MSVQKHQLWHVLDGNHNLLWCILWCAVWVQATHLLPMAGEWTQFSCKHLIWKPPYMVVWLIQRESPMCSHIGINNICKHDSLVFLTFRLYQNNLRQLKIKIFSNFPKLLNLYCLCSAYTHPPLFPYIYEGHLKSLWTGGNAPLLYTTVTQTLMMVRGMKITPLLCYPHHYNWA